MGMALPPVLAGGALAANGMGLFRQRGEGVPGLKLGPSVAKPKAAPDLMDDAMLAARRRAKALELSRSGRTATFVTGPGGVTGPLNLSPKTLLGS